MSNNNQDLGCSQRAISVARILDRLDPGDYLIRLSKAGNSKAHYWTIEIDKQIKVDKKILSEKG